MYEAITKDIKVSVEPVYLDHESEPDASRFFWAYRVVIENQSEKLIQLRTRHWKISDAAGNVEEVNGDGVIGQQPYLKPGRSFEYTSGCPLTTSSGFMMGSYGMIDEDGDEFAVEIPAFSLDMPGDVLVLN